MEGQLVAITMSVHLGKFLVWASVGSTAAAEAVMGGRGHLKRILDREPVVALSVVLGGIGFLAPQIVPPIRRSMGYDTSQWDGRPGEAPLTAKQVRSGWLVVSRPKFIVVCDRVLLC